jgi:hypothetical protein
MAIVIEEEKKNSNTLAVFGWLVVIAIIVAAVYYIFFVTPPPTIIAPSGVLGTIGSISSSTANPQDVVNSAEFQALQQYVAEPSSTGPAPVGRQNPFLAP